MSLNVSQCPRLPTAHSLTNPFKHSFKHFRERLPRALKVEDALKSASALLAGG